MGKRAIGIDIGGTGIKAGVVDIRSGTLIGERLRRDTPAGGRPADIAQLVTQIIKDLPEAKAKMLIGICFPAITKNGVTLSAANVSAEWIGLDADDLFTKALGRPVHVLNDADAAGVAEVKYGAGKNKPGLVIMTTLGTGIGTSLFMNGKLIPNAELGHIEIDGVDYETQASYGAKERDGLEWPEWTARLQKYFSTLEKLFTPDLIIVGGGVSKHHQEFLPLLNLKTPIIAAEKRNNAGILGAAAMANKHLR